MDTEQPFVYEYAAKPIVEGKHTQVWRWWEMNERVVGEERINVLRPVLWDDSTLVG
jgi:hypothetical protein